MKMITEWHSESPHIELELIYSCYLGDWNGILANMSALKPVSHFGESLAATILNR